MIFSIILNMQIFAFDNMCDKTKGTDTKAVPFWFTFIALDFIEISNRLS